MQRRSFVKDTGKTGVYFACGLGLMHSACKNYRYVQCVYQGNSLLVKKTSFEEDQFVLVPSEQLGFPVYLRKKDEKYLAISTLCTHKECELRPAGEYLICPCHGSEFSNDGKVLSGPAEFDLLQFPVTIDGDIIRIKIT